MDDKAFQLLQGILNQQMKQMAALLLVAFATAAGCAAAMAYDQSQSKAPIT